MAETEGRVEQDGPLLAVAAEAVPLIKRFSNFHVLQQTQQIRMLMTVVRNRETKRDDFIFYADRVLRILIESALEYLPYVEDHVETPTGSHFDGVRSDTTLCGVSIVRGGEAMETALRAVVSHVRIGKILVSYDDDGTPELLYMKLPRGIADNSYVLLMDPMLASGRTACKATSHLLEHGVAQGNIILVTLCTTPVGVTKYCSEFPEVTVLTCEVDPGVGINRWIDPGLGDFGDRYFGTEGEGFVPLSPAAALHHATRAGTPGKRGVSRQNSMGHILPPSPVSPSTTAALSSKSPAS